MSAVLLHAEHSCDAQQQSLEMMSPFMGVTL